MTAAPQRIRILKSEGVVEILWAPGRCRRYPFKFLRCECPCAGCVNEFTGERTLDPVKVPDDVAPQGAEFSGNYALKIYWSDGHSTGLYSWETLERLESSPAVVACAGA
jgi:DUF971 family protein